MPARTASTTASAREGAPWGRVSRTMRNMLRMDELDAQVVQALGRAGLDVHADAGTRSMYASDASLYRIPPLAVVRPRDVGDVEATLAVARDTGVPVTSRGAGTSVAGNAVGRGVVLDFSRHLNRVLSVDPDTRTAVVEPGTVHAVLQKAAAPHGVRFGPDPSTHPRCTIGGMIGNNACGSRSLAYGRTSDNVAGLELLTAAGRSVVTGYDEGGMPFARGADDVLSGVRTVMSSHLSTARTEFDRFGRQVSGYAAHHLLPERFDLTRALVGSEGTLGVITQASVKLVVDAPVRVVVVLGFPDIVAAGTAAPAVVAHQPISCEGLDSRLIDVLRSRRGPDAIPPLPRGRAWLFVEFAGDELGEVAGRGRRLVAEGLADDAVVVEDPLVQARLWRIREDGAGLAGRAPSGKPAWPGWEDAAVPPDRLGEYLAAFDELVSSYGMTSAPFGHFGDGCMHVRLDLPLDQPDGTKVMREFLTESARLVGGFGGSLSGEHGDGRARSELLPHMYSADAIALFGGIKHAFDPENLLNPGCSWTPIPSTRTCDRPVTSRSGTWRWPTRTTTETSPRPSTGAPASASAGRPTRRPAASCAPRTSRRGRRRTPPGAAPVSCRTSSAASCPGRTRRCTTRWTSACRARGARRTAPPASTWRPTSPRCSTRPTGGGSARAPTTRWGSCRCGRAWPAVCRAWR